MGGGASKINKNKNGYSNTKEPKTYKHSLSINDIFNKLRKHRKDIKVDPKDNMSEKKFLNLIANGIYKKQDPDNEYFKRQEKHHDSMMSRQNSKKSIRGKFPENFDWKEIKEIGRGSFGVIMLGIVAKTNKTYAVKKLPAEGNGEALKEAMKEMELLSQLSHKHIVNFKGYQHKDGYLHIFMDYVTGGSIDDQVQKYGKLSEELTRSYSKQILKGLAYLHRKKVVHGDLKCGNILTTKDGKCKLADFGSAQQILGPQTALDNLIGSIYWMAPEVIKQEGIDYFSDIWSFGAMIYEMIVGIPPFYETKSNQFKVMHKIAATNVLPYIDDNISQQARDFVYCCLRRNPKDRLTATQLLNHPFILDTKEGEDSEGEEVVVKIVNTKKQDVTKQREIDKNIYEMIDRILDKRKNYFPNEFLLQDGEQFLANDDTSPFKKANSKGVLEIFKKYNSGRHGLVKDAETDYLIDKDGNKVYYQKFLKPDFLPKISEPLDPIELAKKRQITNKNKSAFNFGIIKVQQTAPSLIKMESKQQNNTNEQHFSDKDYHALEYTHLEPYLDEKVANLSHKTKKNVYFKLEDDYEDRTKINHEEILQSDMDTDIGSAISTCLNSLGNKIIMSKDTLIATDQNPDDKFIKYNNFLYM